jgi:uncharacterized protein
VTLDERDRPPAPDNDASEAIGYDGHGDLEAPDDRDALAALDDGPTESAWGAETMEVVVEERGVAPGSGEAPAAVEPEAQATAIFIDSSAIVALVDRDDGSHAAAVDAYRNLVRSGFRLFTTNYVIAETFDLLRTGVGPVVARQFLRDCKLAIYHADEQDERRARRHVLDAPGGSNLTLVDAVSLVVMERLSVADAFAVDPSFLGDGD